MEPSNGPIIKDWLYYSFWSVPICAGLYAVKLLYDIRALLK